MNLGTVLFLITLSVASWSKTYLIETMGNRTKIEGLGP